MHLNFYVIKNPNLFVQAGASILGSDQILLSYQISLKPFTEIELTTKENFKDLIGHVTIRAKTERSEEKSEGIGKMLYSPAIENVDARYADNARYIVNVFVPKSQFDEILATARAGYIPSDVLISVSGMDYGCDEDDLLWNNKTFPQLQVDSIALTIPLSLSSVSDATY